MIIIKEKLLMITSDYIEKGGENVGRNYYIISE